MKIVYSAADAIEAYMIKDLLIMEGIEAYIQGEHLQGGVGLLPAINLVKVSVNNKDVAAALTLIKDWEVGQP